jgi:ACS family tartrate transporter-like MFS transporter
LINSLGNTGGFVGPNVIGILKDATGGTTGAFLVLAGVATTCAALCLLLRRWAVFTSRPEGRATIRSLAAAAAMGGPE